MLRYQFATQAVNGQFTGDPRGDEDQLMTFDAIGIAGTGLTVHRKWLDAISDNIANVNTVKSMDDTAFQARYVEVQEGDGTSGVYVKGAAYGSAAGRVVYEPDNPLADAEGYVRMPDIDLGVADGRPHHGPARLPGERRRGRPCQDHLRGRTADRTN